MKRNSLLQQRFLCFYLLNRLLRCCAAGPGLAQSFVHTLNHHSNYRR